jgi:hypothetical protein
VFYRDDIPADRIFRTVCPNIRLDSDRIDWARFISWYNWRYLSDSDKTRFRKQKPFTLKLNGKSTFKKYIIHMNCILNYLLISM